MFFTAEMCLPTGLFSDSGKVLMKPKCFLQPEKFTLSEKTSLGKCFLKLEHFTHNEHIYLKLKMKLEMVIFPHNKNGS